MFLSEDKLENTSDEDGGHTELLARGNKVSDQDLQQRRREMSALDHVLKGEPRMLVLRQRRNQEWLLY